MDETNLLMICVNAFTAVMVLLSLLTLTMRLLITVFPEKDHTVDAALKSAINTAVQRAYPGSHISRIDEIR